MLSNPPYINRRTCLALGAAAFWGTGASASQAPQGIVSLEWTATEMLLTLGLKPIGAGDTPDYRNWVVEPCLPTSVRDLGSRFEPNRELIHRLNPELIVVTNGYGFSPEDWASEAQVHEVFPIAAPNVEPLGHAAEELRRLGERTDQVDAADEFIALTDRAFEDTAETLAERALNPICIVSMFEERSARIYGTGLVDAVVRRLGLVNAWEGEVGPWGFATIGLEQLALLPASTWMLLLDPVPDPVRIRLNQSSLWPNLPLVRAGHVIHIDPVWPFGGLAAAARFARLISAAFSEA